MSMKFFVAALISACTSLAFADQMGPNGDKFYDEAAHFANACQTGTCQAPYKIAVVYNQKSGRGNLETLTTEALRKVAVEQAQIWGDTILEGDFYSAGRTRLDEVKAVYKNNDVIGYKIRYSEKAWYTAECEFDGVSKASLKNCKMGRIVEESYVSSDLKTFFTDEDKQADFSLDLN